MTTHPGIPAFDGASEPYQEALGQARIPGLTDFCTREGALMLKQRIEAYWQERGCQVNISLHNVGFHPAIRAARYELRSDLFNGWPRARCKPTSTAGNAATEDEAAKVQGVLRLCGA